MVPSIQWPSGGQDQNTTQVLEKALNNGEGKMGGRVTNDPLGLPNNSKAAYGRDKKRNNTIYFVENLVLFIGVVC